VTMQLPGHAQKEGDDATSWTCPEGG